MDDLYKNQTFSVKSVPGFNTMNDGLHYTQTDEEGKATQINTYKLSDGTKVKTLFDNSRQLFEGRKIAISDYAFSSDEQKMLLFEEGEHVYRRSVLYRVYVFDLQTQELHLLDTEKVLHALFNPAGSKVAFVKDNNLFVKDLSSGTTTRITTDGKKNAVINGNCDWVYEEEFEFTRAFDWSPDGRYIAYYRFDESKVKEYTIPMCDSANYPRLYTYKYPKAGEDNSVVTIHFYNVEKGTKTNAEIPVPQNDYIPRIKWTPENKLCIFYLNRHQNALKLYLSNPAGSGDYQVIYTETNPYFIKINDNLHFLPGQDAFLFTSEQSGFNHLYLYDWSKKSLTQLTEGSWEVDELSGVDMQTREAYFTAGMQSPLERKLYRVGLDTKKIECLTPEDGWHSITVCNGLQYFLDRHSRIQDVPVYTLLDKNGKPVRTLEDNTRLKKTLQHYNIGTVTMRQFPGDDGASLNGWMITPPGFDSNRKYPVLMYQYSGPGSQEVKDYFPVGNYFWHQMMAQKGYIIVCVDGTGTGGRGEAFEKKTYLQLGNLESNDQIAIARYLSRQTYVNKDRIGIWGWSYGGFMSSTCLLKGASVFKAAVAVAPVTNWRFYDNIYTERYMRTPQENAEGYDQNAPEKMADQLKGKFLLIHGTADDNVHFQNSVVLTKNLIDAGKQFESEYYPDKNHSIYGGNTRRQLFERMTAFIEQNL